MKRLFLDANVLFTAAHNPRGKAALLIALAADGHWQVVTSDLAIAEAHRNLERKYPDCLGALQALLLTVERCPSDLTLYASPALPAKDRPIFASSIATGATHLLTGDLKHFGPYMNQPEACNNVIIQTVSQFLESV